MKFVESVENITVTLTVIGIVDGGSAGVEIRVDRTEEYLALDAVWQQSRHPLHRRRMADAVDGRVETGIGFLLVHQQRDADLTEIGGTDGAFAGKPRLAQRRQ